MVALVVAFMLAYQDYISLEWFKLVLIQQHGGACHGVYVSLSKLYLARAV